MSPLDDRELERLRRKLRRMHVGKLALVTMYCRLRLLGLLVQPPALGLKLSRAIATKKAQYELKRFTYDAAALTSGFNDLEKEFQSVSSESSGNDRRQLLLEKHSALQAEKSRLLITAEALKAPHTNLGIAACRYMLNELQASVFRFSRKREALFKIFSGVDDSTTYYCDLLLWFIVPSSHSEDLAGDLMEEYQLRSGTDGEARARSWYHEQVISTIMDHVPFKKIVATIAAIWTFLQWTYRYFTR
jgi:hypothetical protein